MTEKLQSSQIFIMYKSLNEYLRERFHTKVYKIALSSGCTCPNRDGTIGVGGCIFCGETGSGDFAQEASLSVSEQIKRAKQKIAAKNPGGKYIAYFQSFTNTYGKAEDLEPKFLEAMADEEVVALSVATRPDCLPPEIIAMLERLNGIKPVWVELGLQTIHENTARYIRRGYSLEVYDCAVEKLHNIGVEVIVHVIIGLPGETVEDMKQTVQYVVDSGAEGIKLQLLHVLKDTDLAADYQKGMFQTLTMEEYVSAIRSCVELIPKRVVVHRLTGDGNKNTLVAPLWSADKKRVLNALNKALR